MISDTAFPNEGKTAPHSAEGNHVPVGRMEDDPRVRLARPEYGFATGQFALEALLFIRAKILHGIVAG